MYKSQNEKLLEMCTPVLTSRDSGYNGKYVPANYNFPHTDTSKDNLFEWIMQFSTPKSGNKK